MVKKNYVSHNTNIFISFVVYTILMLILAQSLSYGIDFIRNGELFGVGVSQRIFLSLLFYFVLFCTKQKGSEL